MMEQTSLDIGSIGQKLEAARRAKGVSVSEAGRATKILTRFIEAMEADDFGVLTAPVYAKGFIRMYAQYLGLDARPLVDEYVSQQVPKGKSPLPDEIRKNLTNADETSTEAPTEKKFLRGGITTLGEVNKTIASLSGSGIPLKTVLAAGSGLLLLSLIIFSATQCSEDDEKTPAAAGGAATVERDLLMDTSPDVYLVGPGAVDIEK